MEVYPPGHKTIIISELPIPETVSAVLKEDEYTISFKLTKDEFDALCEIGSDPRVECDNIIRRCKGALVTFAEKYASDCFREGIPLDCMCKNTLFRRYCEKRKTTS